MKESKPINFQTWLDKIEEQERKEAAKWKEIKSMSIDGIINTFFTDREFFMLVAHKVVNTADLILYKITNIPTEIRYFFRSCYQEAQRGFPNCDTWSMDYTIAEFLLLRLKKFKEMENHNSFFQDSYGCISFKRMIKVLELITDEDVDLFLYNEKQWEEVIKEIQFLVNNLFNLQMIVGFHSSQIWNLNVELAKFVYPRLKLFKELNNGIPTAIFTTPPNENGGYSQQVEEVAIERWNNYIQEMINAFELIAQNRDYDTQEQYVIQTGLDRFAQWYFSLWW